MQNLTIGYTFFNYRTISSGSFGSKYGIPVSNWHASSSSSETPTLHSSSSMPPATADGGSVKGILTLSQGILSGFKQSKRILNRLIPGNAIPALLRTQIRIHCFRRNCYQLSTRCGRQTMTEPFQSVSCL